MASTFPGFDAIQVASRTVANAEGQRPAGGDGCHVVPPTPKAWRSKSVRRHARTAGNARNAGAESAVTGVLRTRKPLAAARVVGKFLESLENFAP